MSAENSSSASLSIQAEAKAAEEARLKAEEEARIAAEAAAKAGGRGSREGCKGRRGKETAARARI